MSKKWLLTLFIVIGISAVHISAMEEEMEESLVPSESRKDEKSEYKHRQHKRENNFMDLQRRGVDTSDGFLRAQCFYMVRPNPLQCCVPFARYFHAKSDADRLVKQVNAGSNSSMLLKQIEQKDIDTCVILNKPYPWRCDVIVYEVGSKSPLVQLKFRNMVMRTITWRKDERTIVVYGDTIKDGQSQEYKQTFEFYGTRKESTQPIPQITT